jgi:hypothetical protein
LIELERVIFLEPGTFGWSSFMIVVGSTISVSGILMATFLMGFEEGGFGQAMWAAGGATIAGLMGAQGGLVQLIDERSRGYDIKTLKKIFRR